MLRTASLLILASLIHAADAAESPQADIIAAFTNHLMQADYPELFGNAPYRTRIQNIIVADIDNDGSDELIVHYQPHYRQSATIQIFKVSPNKEITRVTEGLAPGPLLPLSGDYLDSHALGDAVDFSVSGAMERAVHDKTLLAKTLNSFSGLVAYKSFFHGDMRNGKYFIDMTSTEVPMDANNCDKFEFSTVKQIVVGKPANSELNILAAWVDDHIYLYRIGKIDTSGFLEKSTQIIPVPEAFNGFLPNKGLQYLGADGATLLLAVP